MKRRLKQIRGRVKKPVMLDHGETVGHSGDEIGDPAGAIHLPVPALEGRPFRRQVPGRLAVTREQLADNVLGVPHDPHHPGVAIHPLVQERLGRRLGGGGFGSERHQRLRLEPHLLGRRRARRVQPPAGFRDHRFDQVGDQLPDQLRAEPHLLDIGIPPTDLRDHGGGDRDRREVVDHKEPRPQPVVDVVGVVGDVVGDGGDLGFQRGVAPELEIMTGDIVGNVLGNAVLAIGADRPPVPIHQRAVVLDDAFQGLPGQVETVEQRITMLELGDHPQRLGIVVEAALGFEAGVERPFPGMAEWRMPQIMGERQGLGQVLVDAELARQSAGDLGHFQRMGQPGAEMVALVEHEDLGLVLEAAEGGGMDDTVAIAPERAAGAAWRLGKQPSPARIRIAGISRAGSSHSDGHGFSPFKHLIPGRSALNYV